MSDSLTQTFTSLALHNSFESQFALLGCSNRELYCYDFNACRRVADIKTPHLKPVTGLHFFRGASAKKYPKCIQSDNFNIFYTFAADGWAKIWDLRTMKCVR